MCYVKRMPSKTSTIAYASFSVTMLKELRNDLVNDWACAVVGWIMLAVLLCGVIATETDFPASSSSGPSPSNLEKSNTPRDVDVWEGVIWVISVRWVPLLLITTSISLLIDDIRVCTWKLARPERFSAKSTCVNPFEVLSANDSLLSSAPVDEAAATLAMRFSVFRFAMSTEEFPFRCTPTVVSIAEYSRYNAGRWQLFTVDALGLFIVT